MIPGSRKIPWRRDRLPTPVFWPGEFQGLHSSWGHKESDTTEQLSLSKQKVSSTQSTEHRAQQINIHKNKVILETKKSKKKIAQSNSESDVEARRTPDIIV